MAQPAAKVHPFFLKKETPKPPQPLASVENKVRKAATTDKKEPSPHSDASPVPVHSFFSKPQPKSSDNVTEKDKDDEVVLVSTLGISDVNTVVLKGTEEPPLYEFQSYASNFDAFSTRPSPLPKRPIAKDPLAIHPSSSGVVSSSSALSGNEEMKCCCRSQLLNPLRERSHALKSNAAHLSSVLDVAAALYPLLNRKNMSDYLTSLCQSFLDSAQSQLWPSIAAPTSVDHMCLTFETISSLRSVLDDKFAMQKPARKMARIVATQHKKLVDESDEDFEDDAFDEDDDEEEEFGKRKKKKKVSKHACAIVVQGKPGIGRTSIVYAMGHMVHKRILECNSTEKRSGQFLKSMLSEVTQSQSKSLLLFDDVDLLFDDEKGFHGSLVSLIESSKRPVFLTCESVPSEIFDVQNVVIPIAKPSFSHVVAYVFLISRAFGVYARIDSIVLLCRLFDCDIRRILLQMQAMAHVLCDEDMLVPGSISYDVQQILSHVPSSRVDALLEDPSFDVSYPLRRKYLDLMSLFDAEPRDVMWHTPEHLDLRTRELVPHRFLPRERFVRRSFFPLRSYDMFIGPFVKAICLADVERLRTVVRSRRMICELEPYGIDVNDLKLLCPEEMARVSEEKEKEERRSGGGRRSMILDEDSD